MRGGAEVRGSPRSICSRLVADRGRPARMSVTLQHPPRAAADRTTGGGPRASRPQVLSLAHLKSALPLARTSASSISTIAPLLSPSVQDFQGPPIHSRRGEVLRQVPHGLSLPRVRQHASPVGGPLPGLRRVGLARAVSRTRGGRPWIVAARGRRGDDRRGSGRQAVRRGAAWRGPGGRCRADPDRRRRTRPGTGRGRRPGKRHPSWRRSGCRQEHLAATGPGLDGGPGGRTSRFARAALCPLCIERGERRAGEAAGRAARRGRSPGALGAIRGQPAADPRAGPPPSAGGDRGRFDSDAA